MGGSSLKRRLLYNDLTQALKSNPPQSMALTLIPAQAHQILKEVMTPSPHPPGLMTMQTKTHPDMVFLVKMLSQGCS